MVRKDAEIASPDQDEVQKCSGYVDPNCAASNLGSKLSDVQTVFGKIGGHGDW